MTAPSSHRHPSAPVSSTGRVQKTQMQAPRAPLAYRMHVTKRHSLTRGGHVWVMWALGCTSSSDRARPRMRRDARSTTNSCQTATTGACSYASPPPAVGQQARTHAHARVMPQTVHTPLVPHVRSPHPPITTTATTITPITTAHTQPHNIASHTIFFLCVSMHAGAVWSRRGRKKRCPGAQPHKTGAG